ncbi:MAG TPA: hypothetical protein VJM53_10920 [Burkholderiales bacterium]|nr:hypothetical protein [Burkholderiales bacterium]
MDPIKEGNAQRVAERQPEPTRTRERKEAPRPEGPATQWPGPLDGPLGHSET